MSNSLFCFVCLLMGSSDLDPAWVQTGVTDLKHLTEKIKKTLSVINISVVRLNLLLWVTLMFEINSVVLIVFRCKNRLNKLNKIQGLSELADQNNTVKSSSSENNRKNILKNPSSLDFKIRTLLIDQSRVDIKLP
jgi:hypothetical protein